MDGDEVKCGAKAVLQDAERQLAGAGTCLTYACLTA